MPASVFVITGTPGTGKTTLAEKLAKNGFKTINLQTFAIENKCDDGYDELRGSVIIDEDKLFNALLSHLENNEDQIIIEGHYGDLVPEHFVQHCFVITTELKELRQRLTDKGYDERKIQENLQAEIMKECWITALDAFGEDRVDEVRPMPKEELFQYVLSKLI